MTLTGAEIPRRSVHLKPLQDVDRTQVFSITISRPWQLASTMDMDRKGDVYRVVTPTTPSAAFSLSVMRSDLEANALS